MAVLRVGHVGKRNVVKVLFLIENFCDIVKFRFKDFALNTMSHAFFRADYLSLFIF